MYLVSLSNIQREKMMGERWELHNAAASPHEPFLHTSSSDDWTRWDVSCTGDHGLNVVRRGCSWFSDDMSGWMIRLTGRRLKEANRTEWIFGVPWSRGLFSSYISYILFVHYSRIWGYKVAVMTVEFKRVRYLCVCLTCDGIACNVNAVYTKWLETIELAHSNVHMQVHVWN